MLINPPRLMSKCVKSTRRRSRRDGDDDNVAERFERIDEVGRAVADKKVSEGRDSRKEEDKAAVFKQAADVAKENEEKEKAAAVRTGGGGGGSSRRVVGRGGRCGWGVNDAPAAPYWAGMPA